jgi:hypothetical protein
MCEGRRFGPAQDVDPGFLCLDCGRGGIQILGVRRDHRGEILLCSGMFLCPRRRG